MFGLTPEALAFVVFSLGMLVLMGTGMNMGLALVLTGAGMAWVLDFWDTQLLAQNLVAGVDSFPLLAVPFFILAGELMNSGGISRRIIDMAQAWVGHIRGGLGYVAIGAAVLMASMSGSALADTAALATILLPMMRQQGYPMNTSAGLIASGGIIAPIIPPSMPFVIYGVTTNTSISALFVSGIVPGLMMGAGLIFAWRWVLRGMDLPQGQPLPMKDRLRATARAFWAMLMPIIIIGGMKTGVFTPTEAAVVAVFYGLFVGMVIHRTITVRDLFPILRESGELSAVILIVVSLAGIFAYSLSTLGVIDPVANAIVNSGLGEYGVLALLIVLLITVGMFLDGISIFLIFVPLLLPIMQHYHWDPVWFGVILTLKVALGQFTPPLAVNLMVSCRIAGVRMESTVRWVGWMLLAMFLVMVLVIAFPPLALWLPARLGY